MQCDRTHPCTSGWPSEAAAAEARVPSTRRAPISSGRQILGCVGILPSRHRPSKHRPPVGARGRKGRAASATGLRCAARKRSLAACVPAGAEGHHGTLRRSSCRFRFGGVRGLGCRGGWRLHGRRRRAVLSQSLLSGWRQRVGSREQLRAVARSGCAATHSQAHWRPDIGACHPWDRDPLFGSRSCPGGRQHRPARRFGRAWAPHRHRRVPDAAVVRSRLLPVPRSCSHACRRGVDSRGRRPGPRRLGSGARARDSRRRRTRLRPRAARPPAAASSIPSRRGGRSPRATPSPASFPSL